MMIVYAFDSQDLTFFTNVLERACSDMGVTDENRRQATAARIMHMARTGERDFEVLREYATAMASNSRDQHELPRPEQMFLPRRFSMIDAAY